MTIPITLLAPWILIALLSAAMGAISTAVFDTPDKMSLKRWLRRVAEAFCLLTFGYVLTQQGYIIWK